MFFRELFINLKDDKQRREKEWREKVNTKPLSWDLTSEGESWRWSYFREEEVEEGKEVLRAAVTSVWDGNGGQKRDLSCWVAELSPKVFYNLRQQPLTLK